MSAKKQCYMIGSYRRAYLLCLLLPLLGLSAKQKHQRAQVKKITQGTYQEKLPIYKINHLESRKRSKDLFPLPSMAPLNQAQRLDELLAQKKIAHGEMIQGFTIQTYIGSSKAKALRMQDQLTFFALPDIPVVQYREPHYTVRFGFFSSKLEAYFKYVTLHKKCPQAIIRPFSIDRALFFSKLTDSSV